MEDEEGGISDYMGADFGCLVVDARPESEIQVGDCLHVKGDLAREPLRLAADNSCWCDDDDDGDRLLACRLRHFQGHWDRVRGHVQRVGIDDDGQLRAMILGVLVDLTDAGKCDDDD